MNRRRAADSLLRWMLREKIPGYTGFKTSEPQKLYVGVRYEFDLKKIPKTFAEYLVVGFWSPKKSQVMGE